MRTYCGLVNEKFLDQEIELYGWVDHLRVHGSKLAFINLRDRFGIIQIVVDDEKNLALAKEVHPETVLKVVGKVRKRPENLFNPEMSTGKWEVLAETIIILNQASPLPFNLKDNQLVSEELRLKFRYLDMRRPELVNRLKFRSDLYHKIHQFFYKENFIEIETPLLTKSTPEGARDFLVPTRLNPGFFYALPQSPQLFKQLLMVGGVDRYYQIARCFRDEDLRSDRQPEFTQLDVEMSFVDQSLIMELFEELIRYLFKELLMVDLPAAFPRLTYQEAMSKYGSDKPDLRCSWELKEITQLVCEWNLPWWQEGDKAIVLKISQKELSRKQFENIEVVSKSLGLEKLSFLKITNEVNLTGLSGSLVKFINEQTFARLQKFLELKPGDYLLIGTGKGIEEAMGVIRLKVADLFDCISKEWKPLWVVDFPMFTNEPNGITFMHHPFTMPSSDDPNEIINNPLGLKSKAYDLVLNGTELGGGSIRINRRDVQMAVFKVLGLTEEVVYSRFGHLLEAFQYGYPPEGGIAIGLDRLTMLMTQTNSLREVIAFPKTQTGACPLTEAPSEVEPNQLSDTGIKLI